MADKRYGYLPIWRGIWENYLFSAKDRFDNRSAWMWLMFQANYKDKEYRTNRGTLIVIKRGQVFTSLDSLAERFQWNKRTVMRFLQDIKSTGMIDYKSSRDGTLITLLNYNKYNNPTTGDSGECTAECTAECTGEYTGERTAEYTHLNNDNTDKAILTNENEAPRRRGGWGNFEK